MSQQELRHAIPDFKYRPWRSGEYAQIDIPPSNLDFVIHRMQRRGQVIRVHDYERFYDPVPKFLLSSKVNIGQKFTHKETAREWLAKRYLHWYGPVDIHDFTWHIDCRLFEAKRIFNDLPVVPVTVEGQSGAQKYILESDLHDFSGPDPSCSDDLILLPMRDPLLSGLRGKGAEFISNTKILLTHSGHVKPLIVKAGNILGTWSLDVNSLKIIPSWIDIPSLKIIEDFELQASKLSAFIAAFPDMPPRIPEVFISNN